MEERELPRKETLSVEFKSDVKRLPDSELIDTVVALANTDGGIIYLGVEDDGKVTGVHPIHADVTQLAALIANKTVPPVPARVSTTRLASNGVADAKGVQVTAVEIAKSKAIVASSDGKIMRRRLKADGSPESVPLYPYEVITRLSSLGQLDYSAFPVPDTSVSELSVSELERLRSLIAKGLADQTLAGLSDEEILAALRMTSIVDGKVVPTVTGILLAGKPEVIARAVPTAGATFQVLEGTEVRVNQDFEQPLLYTIEKIGEMLEPWNPEREFEDGLFRRSIPLFDKRAFREALVNAFGHRDYAALGRVRVLVDDEGLSIANPGGFVEGVSVENLLTAEPHGRNECLMNALKRIGLAEKAGRGVDRIYEGSLNYGRPLPDYSDSTSTYVRVFIARSAPDELFMRMIWEEQARTGKPLSLRSLMVLDALKSRRRLTLAELSRQLPFAEGVTRATVEGLVEAGLVEGWGSTSGRTYILSAKVYSRAGKDAAFVRQSGIEELRYAELVSRLAGQQGGRVTTRDVESLLHVSNKQAYRVIRKMVADGTLRLAGRGRGAFYMLVSEDARESKG